jgi:hypothetical protein
VSSDSPLETLFFCVARSARSQLAAAPARRRFGTRVARDAIAALLPRLDALVEGEVRP